MKQGTGILNVEIDFDGNDGDYDYTFEIDNIAKAQAIHGEASFSFDFVLPEPVQPKPIEDEPEEVDGEANFTFDPFAKPEPAVVPKPETEEVAGEANFAFDPLASLPVESITLIL